MDGRVKPGQDIGSRKAEKLIDSEVLEQLIRVQTGADCASARLGTHHGKQPVAAPIRR